MIQILSVDCEATGLGPKDRAFGVAWMLSGYEPRYIDFRAHSPREFYSIVRDTDCRIVCHNASYDYRMLKNAGITMPIDRLDDTVIRATLINEHEPAYDLDSLASKYLGQKKTVEIWEEMAQQFGGKPTRRAQIGRISEAPWELVKTYAIPDAVLCHDLWQWQQQEIEKQRIQRIVDFERRVMPAIIRAEVVGVRVDVEEAVKAVSRLDDQIEQRLRALYASAGGEFNINSPKDVRRIYMPKQREDGQWVTRNGHLIDSTPSGEPSFNSDSLKNINDAVSTGIIDCRSLIKTRDTFLKGHVLNNQIDGRVYPSIHQTKGEDGGTGTGRFSYTSPALQQIPSRDLEIASIIKRIFLPDEGQVWLDADKHSFEVRIFAHLVNQPKLNREYAECPSLDFHQYVADLTGLPRKARFVGDPNAKTLNLATLFACGNGLIANMLGLPWEWQTFKTKGKEVTYRKAGPEAMALIEKYHAMIPGVKELAERARAKAKQFGYIETHMGRRLRFPNPEKVHKASALAVQANAADINKNNWLLIEEAMEGEGRLILNIHDSYGMSVPEDWADIWKRVKSRIEEGYPWLRIPILLELSGAGKNWWNAIEG